MSWAALKMSSSARYLVFGNAQLLTPTLVMKMQRRLYGVVLQGVPASFWLILGNKVEFWKCFDFQPSLEIQDTIE